ncbi:fibronectin type III domain-containing protein [Parapedobacter sp. 2B3]|uniref:fibronectin type III domain-containing protein n=1 Tax=Parapedobacter sp. 2B3 TaxID=3342381 RepID=UPI0035B5763B
MRQERIYTDYHRWSDDALAALAGRTVEFMTDNAAFAAPQPDLATYTALVSDFRQKHEIARNRGSLVEVTAKNKARKALLRAMKQLAFYINFTADGDAHLLAGSGFVLTDQPQALRKPHAPLIGTLEDGEISGELNFRFEAIANAWEYEYQVASTVGTDGQPEWGEIARTTNSLKNLLAPVVPGTRYYARVRARNGKGESDWSATFAQFAR